MVEREALQVALDMFRSPTLVRPAQRLPLPKNVLQVIRIAAGETLDDKAIESSFGWSETELRAAAVFYLQQILFDKNSDAYRLLGISSEASLADLKDHKRALLKWLHPDRNANKWESILLQRVISAADSILPRYDDAKPYQTSPALSTPSNIRLRHKSRHQHSLNRGIEVKRVRKPIHWLQRLRSFVKRMSLIASALTLIFLGARAISKSEDSTEIVSMARNMFAWID
jgi:hypothetical protein